MPAIVPPTANEILSWEVQELGVLDGSSPNETLEVDHNTATRRFRCKWAARWKVAWWLVGYSQTYLDGAGTLRLSRLLPQTHPDQTTWAATKITRMTGYKFAGYDVTNGVNTFDRADLEVLYEQVPYNLVADGDITSELDRYVEYPAGDPEPGGEYLSLPGAAFRYTAQPGSGLTKDAGSPIDTTRIAANVGKIVPQEVFRVAWHRLPFDLWSPGSALYQRIFGTAESDDVPFFGAINRATFFGRSHGTCLLTGVKPFRRKSPTGWGFELDLVLEVGYKPSGWNWVYGYSVSDDPALSAFNGWYEATTDGFYAEASSIGDYKSIYCARDLNQLFQVN